jgi:signal transduction histidine kinase
VALAAAEKTAVTSGGSASLRESLFRVEAGLLGATLLVTDESGAVQRTSDDRASVRALDLTRLGATDESGVRSATVRGAGGSPLLIVAAPVGDGRQLVAVQRLSEIRAAQAGVLGLAAGVLLLALVVAWFVGGWIARRLTGPLVRLEAGAERIAAGEFGATVPEEGDAETASLARSFNRMSERVAQAYDAQRSFVGDVSHEIRTPLTSINGFAGALLDGTIAEQAAQKRALQVIATEAGRIQDLSDTLLALAQLDAGAVELGHDRVDVQALATALESRFEATAASREIALMVALLDEHRLVGDQERLLQAASTLVSNALAYAPVGGKVVVASNSTEDMWRLLVDDDGPGIPAEKREMVFERFARLDESRASSSGGAGLGLAICARLAELMGGRLGVDDSPLGGARFVLELPLSA